MPMKLCYGDVLSDKEWACDYHRVVGDLLVERVRVCHVRVNNLQRIAEELAKKVQDTSWMIALDRGAQRAYERTVSETAAALVKIFRDVGQAGAIDSEFGEVMVSIGSAKALETIFEHRALPIAELWKPQIKQNEGFDFHTICKSDLINFGEAKFSRKSSPHGDAIAQARGFIEDEKHLRDWTHLSRLVPGVPVENLENDSYGVVAAFSLNAADPLLVLRNSVESAQQHLESDKIKAIYLVGVSH